MLSSKALKPIEEINMSQNILDSMTDLSLITLRTEHVQNRVYPLDENGTPPPPLHENQSDTSVLLSRAKANDSCEVTHFSVIKSWVAELFYRYYITKIKL